MPPGKKQDRQDRQDQQSVTVIGLGPMGQAMAGAYLDRGYAVTLWNRTASRADALVARGAVLAPSAAAALEAGELVVLSLTDYAAVYAVLEPAAGALKGRTIVNLSSDTPERTRAGAEWFAGHGAVQLTGGVTVSPAGVGQEESVILYSGPRAVFDRHRAALDVLAGVADHRGEDPGLAALLYQINMGIFWTAMLSYWQAVALAEANGLSATDILPFATDTSDSLAGFFTFYAGRIDAGDHTGDVDRLAMGAASVDHVLHTMADAGVDTTLPATVAALFERGMAAGYGADSFSRVMELIRAS
ncbi:NAD(P)-dependent oxidoreductase [Streptomyces harbinensis]